MTAKWVDTSRRKGLFAPFHSLMNIYAAFLTAIYIITYFFIFSSGKILKFINSYVNLCNKNYNLLAKKIIFTFYTNWIVDTQKI